MNRVYVRIVLNITFALKLNPVQLKLVLHIWIYGVGGQYIG